MDGVASETSKRSGLERRVFLTGASGYVGGRLLRALERRGEDVRCLARRPEFLRPKVGRSTEVVRGDVLDLESLRSAMRDVDVAYYLVHSMSSRGDFEAEDREAALNFAKAAREAGVGRIVYLGGLGREPGLSRHLRSRHEVGRVLRESGIPTIEFRASIIIGSGSLSFEMIRALVEKLPLMTTPRWVSEPAQPLAIEDLVDYLLAALDVRAKGSVVYEIGGADRCSYLEIMKEYARQRGLKRAMIRVPVLSPGLSSLWLGLVTPLYARVGRKLIDSVRNATVVKDETALAAFDIQPHGIREAIERALANEDRELAETRWSDALSSGATSIWGGAKYGSRIVDSRSVSVPLSPAEAFRPVRRIGGSVGWYFADPLWRLRGFLDLLVGGVGVRRGRRDPDQLAPGDTVDFWRVEAYEPGALLRLYAEMKLPGRAWLQFEVRGTEHGSAVRQTAIFDPLGLAGLIYWYALYPIHMLVFSGMLRGIVRAMGPAESSGLAHGAA
ncbi:MAG: SDR family oxidoreductase [Gemmatimonadota bacterium]|nr:MAG: SDR family oxidoreductase [Gemmatimonadota bacterium]